MSSTTPVYHRSWTKYQNYVEILQFSGPGCSTWTLTKVQCIDYYIDILKVTMANLGKSRGRVLVPSFSANECATGSSSRGIGRTATPPLMPITSPSCRNAENTLPHVSYGLLSNEDYLILRRFFQPSSMYDRNANILLKIGKLDVYLPRKSFEHIFPIFVETSSEPFLTINENPSHFFQMIKCLFPCPNLLDVDETNVYFLLELSINYRVSIIINKCKFHMLKSVNERNWTKYLTLARKLRLKYLAAFIIRRAASFSYQYLKQCYGNLPSKILNLILDAKISITENMNLIASSDVTRRISIIDRDLSPENLVLEDVVCRQCCKPRKANVHSTFTFLYLDQECVCFKIRNIDDRLLLSYLKPIATNIISNSGANG